MAIPKVARELQEVNVEYFDKFFQVIINLRPPHKAPIQYFHMGDSRVPLV